MKSAALVLLALLIGMLALLVWGGHVSRQSPPELDLVQGRLRPCLAAPNCVGSEGSDAAHAIAALPFQGDRRASEYALVAALEALPRTAIHRRQGDYWHATQRSEWFGFVDDIEMRFDDAAGVIQIRAAARVGYWDFGASRRRVEALRAAYRVPR